MDMAVEATIITIGVVGEDAAFLGRYLDSVGVRPSPDR